VPITRFDPGFGGDKVSRAIERGPWSLALEPLGHTVVLAALQKHGSLSSKKGGVLRAIMERSSAPAVMAVPEFPSDLLSGCGRGGYRDPATHACRGPADVGR
jgi:hypothetical protein